MPELPTPRSSKKRRIQGGHQTVSPPSVNRRINNSKNHKTLQIPIRPGVSRPRSSHRNTSSTPGSAVHNSSAHDVLSTQIYDLFNQLDELRDSLSKAYHADRKARQEAHENTQKQLAGMQDFLQCIAQDHVQMKRRERMGLLELGLFGANGVVNSGNHELSSIGFEDSMANDEATGDVDMEDIDDSQCTELGLDESSKTLGARLRGPLRVESDGDDEEEEGEEQEQEEEEEIETEDDSLPIARARLRRHVSQTISPTIPPQHPHEGSTTESDTPAEDESETISVRALKRSLQLGTRPKKTLNLGAAESRSEGFFRRGAQQREPEETNADQALSQYSVPPNPEEEDDETYRESPITTPEREVQPVEPRMREVSVELEYGLSSPRKQRPQRKTAQVENYYDWDRYVIGGRTSVAATPMQNKDRGKELLNGSPTKTARRGKSSDPSPEPEIVEGKITGGRIKNGKGQSNEIGEKVLVR
ncbi:hypothetical protein TWF730_005561 [Orbilia blumenaviensis]|uniref:Shugoshin C-terminal domain-containing protein n=1 Tax=Orbilia blumenaviensis TaxID=1796055 RepID=A0AAV9VIZ1_9PEZI